MKKLVFCIVTLMALGLGHALAQPYSLTGSITVKAGGPFSVTWTAPANANRNADTVAMCDSSGKWLAYVSTQGSVIGSSVFVAAPIPVLTMKYFRSNPWFRGVLYPAPVATFWVYVIP